MSDQNKQKKRRDPHVFDDNKLYLFTTPINPGDRAPRLRIKLYENNPIVDVDYGQKTDKGYQVSHDTPIDPIVLQQILTLIEMAAKSKGECAFELDNWGHPFMWDRELSKNVRSKEKMNISRIEIGKRDSGEVYLKYAAVKKPEVEFVFRDKEDYHRLQIAGNPMPISILSSVAATSWAKAMNAIYFSFYANQWEEPEWRKRFRLEMMQKNSGGGNRNSGGGNYQKPQQTPAAAPMNNDYDEDFPY